MYPCKNLVLEAIQEPLTTFPPSKMASYLTKLTLSNILDTRLCLTVADQLYL